MKLGSIIMTLRTKGSPWFQKQDTNSFKDGLQKLVQRWRKCIEVRGDFVEK